ncbi:MAG: hypothetical protein LH650_13215 [Chloroflexi bacterium]|nr:hypothetical protein [Chloroflexota bacterium]
MTPTILAAAGLDSGPSPFQTDLAVIILAAMVLLSGAIVIAVVLRRRTR